MKACVLLIFAQPAAVAAFSIMTMEAHVFFCESHYLPFRGDSPVPRGGGALPHGSALRPPACTPSSISRPPRSACIWPVQRGARLTLSLCKLCPLRKSPRSQSNPTPCKKKRMRHCICPLLRRDGSGSSSRCKCWRGLNCAHWASCRSDSIYY
jgi:hypothetical protein